MKKRVAASVVVIFIIVWIFLPKIKKAHRNREAVKIQKRVRQFR
ncbi:MAG: hypothetical protein PHE24_03805 [Patescibacteria group bacterium]|nr:hypothetical protein [Patescibacteria group bacterium]